MENERQIIKIDERTYAIEEGFVRWFLLIGDEKAAVIDSGVYGPGVKALAKSLTDKELILINTHGDGDHTAGNSEFDSFFIGEADYNNRDFSKTLPNAKASFLKDGEVIDLGNRELEIITVEGHTYGSVAIYDKSTKTLIAGDTIQDGVIYMFGAHRNPEAYGDSLKKLINRQTDFDVILSSHGTLSLPGDYSEKVLASWQDVRNGNGTCEEVELHGFKVKCVKADNCGFYLA